jgi:hypothetical protein
MLNHAHWHLQRFSQSMLGCNYSAVQAQCCDLLSGSVPHAAYATVAVVSVVGREPKNYGRTPVPAQDRDACRPSWGRPHRPRHVQVGLTSGFVLAAGKRY